MAHDHNHKKGHHHDHHQASENIKVAFFLNLSFTILEVIGGLLTNSMAILSDALHDFGDSVSLGIAWYFEKYSTKGPDKVFTFGYSRFSLVGAIVNSIILVVGSLFILLRAVPRLLAPEEVHSGGMILMSILGIIINGIAVLRLRTGSSLNEKVVLWHLLEDLLGWVAVLAAGIILVFFDIPVIDPILSILITIYILYNVIKNLKEIFYILLQGVPTGFNIDELEEELKEIDGIVSVYHTHIWSLEGEKNMLSTHLVINNNAQKNDIINLKKEARLVLEEKGIGHVTIEFEFEDEDCLSTECSRDKEHL